VTQAERRKYLIKYLLNENPKYKGIEIPQTDEEQKYLFRSLVNVRPPLPAGDDFLHIQNAYLQEENKSRGITDISDLNPVANKDGFGKLNYHEDLYLWCGDITTLKVDAIVNAANSGMTGCWHPNHACIDNCIHTFAGIQLRAVCSDIMKKQGHEEPIGTAKITPAFNLPCKFVLHTVGPLISGKLTECDCALLASCYKSCLDLAVKNGCESIAFCCISTGVFQFPQNKAAEIAIETVRKWKEQTESKLKVVFNVFSEKDEAIYRELLYEREN
jgi:O-acetyl-ADP-ribose deacetylase (regulator of RNase III)